MTTPDETRAAPAAATAERRSPVVSLLLGYLAVTSLAYVFISQATPRLDLWTDLIHLPFPVLGLIVFTQATAATRDPEVRGAWYFLTIGQLFAVAGDITWVSADATGSEVSTAAYVLWSMPYGLFTLAGLVRLMRSAPTEPQRKGDWLDAAVMIAAGCVLAWTFAAQETARLESGDVGALALYFLDTSINFGLLYVSAALWLRRPPAIPRRTLAWFVGAFAIYLVADLIFERLSYLKLYHGGTYIDVIYNIAAMALVLGADAYRRRPARAAAPETIARRTDLVPLVATVVACVPLLLEAPGIDLTHTPLFGIAVGLAVLLLLVLWRQRLARTEIEALVERRIGLEHQLWQAQKMEAIGRLSGGIAHDFNNILAAISSHAQLLRTADGRPGGNEIEEIEYAAQRAAALTRRLLAFTRADVTAPSQVSISQVVRAMEPMLRRLLIAPVHLALDLTDEDTWVSLSDGQLEQVLLNLAVNARDAMPDGGRLRLATRRLRVHGGDALVARGVAPGVWGVLEVADTGLGMDAAVQARLFEPFFTTKPRGHGTGLGLVTVSGITGAARGHVLVDTKPGTGTTMTVLFPAVDAPIAAPSPPRETAAPAPRGAGSTVLVVDDEVAVRRAITIYLKRNGYTVVEAEHGARALALLDELGWRVDLVLTDVEMPEMNGLDLAREIRRRDPSLPLLYMSGFVDGRRSAGDREVELAAASVLTKPFDLAFLLERVRDALRGRAAG